MRMQSKAWPDVLSFVKFGMMLPGMDTKSKGGVEGLEARQYWTVVLVEPFEKRDDEVFVCL